MTKEASLLFDKAIKEFDHIKNEIPNVNMDDIRKQYGPKRSKK